MNDPYDLEAIPRPRGGNIARSKAATEKLRLMPDAAMSDKQAAMIDAAIAAAERRGEARILREIAAKLPSTHNLVIACDNAPGQRGDWWWCRICGEAWADKPNTYTHPQNDCWLARAQQAAQEDR